VEKGMENGKQEPSSSVLPSSHYCCAGLRLEISYRKEELEEAAAFSSVTSLLSVYQIVCACAIQLLATSVRDSRTS
jgi:hypothetical protein